MTTALPACADRLATMRAGHDGARTSACCETSGDIDTARASIHGQETTA
jgi:hypothetical protein